MSNTPPSTEHIDVRYTAQLARLAITDAEAESFQRQLDKVLEHIEALTQVDVDGVEPMTHVMPVQNVLRSDEPRESLDREDVLRNAPAQLQNLIQVPNILD